MSLSTYSLLSLDEFKASMSIPGSAADFALELILNRVTDEIEDFLGRQIVTRTTADPLTRLTEYHTMWASGARVDTDELFPREWPIIAVTTVHEDWALPHTYGASALLVVDTDYQVVASAKPRSLIRRLNGGTGLPWRWATESRSIKLVYSAGYATTAAVPARIKAVAQRYAALLWDEQKRGAYGISGQSDSLGNFTRFAAPQLSADMQRALANEQRNSFWESGEAA